MERVFEPLSRLIPKSPNEVGATARKFMMAGYRNKSAVTIFFRDQDVLDPLCSARLDAFWVLCSPCRQKTW